MTPGTVRTWICGSVLAALVVAGCGGTTRPRVSSASTTTTTTTPTSTTIDADAVCESARRWSVNVVDATGAIKHNVGEGFNHAVDLANALADGSTSDVTTLKAAMQEHLDSVPRLDNELAKAMTLRDDLVKGCRTSLAGAPLTAPCEAVFTASDHELTHLREALDVLQPALAAMQDLVAALEAGDRAAARSASNKANQLVQQANDLQPQIDEAFTEVENATAACGGATTTTTPSSVPATADLTMLANELGCTDLATTSPRGAATATGTCTFEGEQVILSTYVASYVPPEVRALDYCTPDGLATVAHDDTWLVAAATTAAALKIPDVAARLGGQVTAAFC